MLRISRIRRRHRVFCVRRLHRLSGRQRRQFSSVGHARHRRRPHPGPNRIRGTGSGRQVHSLQPEPGSRQLEKRYMLHRRRRGGGRQRLHGASQFAGHLHGRELSFVRVHRILLDAYRRESSATGTLLPRSARTPAAIAGRRTADGELHRPQQQLAMGPRKGAGTERHREPHQLVPGTMDNGLVRLYPLRQHPDIGRRNGPAQPRRRSNRLVHHLAHHVCVKQQQPEQPSTATLVRQGRERGATAFGRTSCACRREPSEAT